jgi:hypothetical protein
LKSINMSANIELSGPYFNILARAFESEDESRRAFAHGNEAVSTVLKCKKKNMILRRKTCQKMHSDAGSAQDWRPPRGNLGFLPAHSCPFRPFPL